MGLFSDHKKIHYKGNVIEVECRVAGLQGKAQYSLVINNKRVDTIEGTLGKFSLRGEIPGDSAAQAVPLSVRVDQGWFGTKYFLEVEGQSLRMENVR